MSNSRGSYSLNNKLIQSWPSCTIPCQQCRARGRLHTEVCDTSDTAQKSDLNHGVTASWWQQTCSCPLSCSGSCFFPVLKESWNYGSEFGSSQQVLTSGPNNLFPFFSPFSNLPASTAIESSYFSLMSGRTIAKTKKILLCASKQTN